MASTPDRAVPERSCAIREVLQAVDQILEAAHLERVANLSIMGSSVAIEPSKLADGEAIAHALGLTETMDHVQAVPPITDWTGDVAGLEVHVRALLRTPAGQSR